MNPPKYSVVVCVKNEEARMEECLKRIYLNEPDEVIVVDGESSDNTVAVAKKFPAHVITSKRSNLTRDRQTGIDAAKNDLIVMIDADHRLEKDDIASLIADLERYQLDIVQSQLASFENHNYWTAAEESAWELTHNIPGQKTMIGTAPAVYKKHVFNYAKFDDNITKTIDDTDFIYRLSKFPHIKVGIGDTKIKQLHFADFAIYFNKFKWYGKGDGEFCLKNPKHAPKMIYHLLFRYPVIYSARSLRKGQPKAVPFFIIQGLTRFYGLAKFFAKR